MENLNVGSKIFSDSGNSFMSGRTDWGVSTDTPIQEGNIVAGHIKPETAISLDDHLKDLTPEEQQAELKRIIQEVADEEGITVEEVEAMIQQFRDTTFKVEDKKRSTKKKNDKAKAKMKAKQVKKSRKRNR